MRLGIDIGGTNTKVALFNKSELLKEKSFKTPKEDFFHLLEEIRTFFGEVNHIGIAAPNVYEGELLSPPNLNWKNLDLKKQVLDFFPTSTASLWHDSHAMAYGHSLYYGLDKTNSLFLTLGTGIGSCARINGQFIAGMELGHIRISEEKINCSCGRFGHLESFCGAKGFRDLYFSLSGNHCEAKEIYIKAKAKDPMAIQSIEYYFSYLFKGVEIAATMLPLKNIYLTGGMAKILELYNGRELNVFPKRQISISYLEGEKATLGAAYL